MILGEKRYKAKLLLFGEYSVLHGSKAFSFPLSSYYANWSKNESPASSLADFIAHAKETLSQELDLDRMDKEYKEGLYLESNIPYGYGLGSSGSLVAAYLDRYLLSKDHSLESLKIKTAALESFFHGKSSGTDPLVSYFNYPLVFHDSERIELVSRALSTDALHFYLLDSGQQRVTRDLVKNYLKQYSSDPHFAEGAEKIADLNDDIIRAALDASSPTLFEKIKRLSALQFTYFQAMILPEINALWKDSLEKSEYAFKLCGAGGGGFYLVISRAPMPLDMFDGYTMLEVEI